jgi:hypothetical protein
LIITEGLEPEALNEISLKMDKIMEISQKELILTHRRQKFRMNEIYFLTKIAQQGFATWAFPAYMISLIKRFPPE